MCQGKGTPLERYTDGTFLPIAHGLCFAPSIKIGIIGSNQGIAEVMIKPWQVSSKLRHELSKSLPEERDARGLPFGWYRTAEKDHLCRIRIDFDNLTASGIDFPLEAYCPVNHVFDNGPLGGVIAGDATAGKLSFTCPSLRRSERLAGAALLKTAEPFWQAKRCIEGNNARTVASD